VVARVVEEGHSYAQSRYGDDIDEFTREPNEEIKSYRQ